MAQRQRSKESSNLEVYVVNVWPYVEKNLPIDHEGVVDRKNDITHSNQTKSNQKVALLVSDYYNLANKLLALAKEKGATKVEIDAILLKNPSCKSMKRTGVKKCYEDLMKDQFIFKGW